MPSRTAPKAGVDAIVDAADELAGERIRQIAVGKIDRAKDNPRRRIEDLDDLGASIRSVGIIQPLIVTNGGRKDRYRLVAGHRRHAAAVQAGLDAVPCVVRDLDDAARREAMLVENLHRADLDPLEEATGYRQLVDLGLSQRTIADRVGRSQGHVSKRLSLLRLPKGVHTRVRNGSLPLEDAVALVKLVDHPDHLGRALKAISDPYSYGRTDYHITRELDAIAGEKKRAEAIAELERRQLRVIDLPEGYGPASIRDGMLPIGVDWHSALDLDPAEHATGACHAVAVVRDGAQIPVCTQPHAHPGVGTVAAAQGDARAADMRLRTEQRRERVAACRARHDQVGAVLRDLTVSAEVETAAQDLVAWAIAHTQSAWADTAERACRLLGLLDSTPPASEQQALRDYARDISAGRVLQALRAGRLEHDLEMSWADPDPDTLDAYRAWLTAHDLPVPDVDEPEDDAA